MKKLRIAAIAAAALAVLCAAGCGGGGGEPAMTEYNSPNDDKLVALVQAGSGGSIEEENGMLYAEVAVRVPDFEALMEKHHEEAEQAASDGEDYERRLYELVYNDPDVEDTEMEFITVDLSAIDPEKTDWTEDEIRELAKQAAFDEAAESFAMQQIQEQETYFAEVVD